MLERDALFFQRAAVLLRASEMSTALGRGIYTLSEAASLTGLRTARVREWFWVPPSGKSRQSVFHSDYEAVDGEYAISFHDLIDVYVVGRLRRHRIPVQTIRKVYEQLRNDLASEHPFCRRELLNDGKVLLLRGADSAEAAVLNKVLTTKGVFAKVLLPFFKALDYDQETRLARRWRIGPSVIVDPGICFGAPIVEAARIPTWILAAAHRANQEDADMVARWYGVEPKDVLAAARFERDLAA
jgi:uncharacterized protein (DUF433 family)